MFASAPSSSMLNRALSVTSSTNSKLPSTKDKFPRSPKGRVTFGSPSQLTPTPNPALPTLSPSSEMLMGIPPILPNPICPPAKVRPALKRASKTSPPSEMVTPAVQTVESAGPTPGTKLSPMPMACLTRPCLFLTRAL